MASGRVSKVKGKVVDIPNAPTIGTATAGAESVSIAFTADSSGKGGPTFSYIAKSNPGNITATGSTSPINVTGLTAGTSYTISVAGVNPTGTGEYSSASGSTTPTVATSFESIATLTVGSGGASNVEFTSIPSTYTHLQIRCIHKNGTSNNGFDIQLNSDNTAGRHTIHSLGGDGSGLQVVSNTSNNFSRLYGSSTQWGSAVIDVLDYKNTNKYKTLRALCGYDANGSGFVSLNSGLYNQTTAISSIKLFPSSGASWSQYSHFALYGIKGA